MSPAMLEILNQLDDEWTQFERTVANFETANKLAQLGCAEIRGCARKGYFELRKVQR